MLHKIVRHELVRDGSTFRAVDADFLTCTTHDVRLTDVLEDADGSVLFIDMGAWFTYGFPGNPLPKPEALGAIYRIRRIGAERSRRPTRPGAGHRETVSRGGDRPARSTPGRWCATGRSSAWQGSGCLAVPGAREPCSKTPAAHAAFGPPRRGLGALPDRRPAARAAVRLALADPDASVRTGGGSCRWPLARRRGVGRARQARRVRHACRCAARPPRRSGGSAGARRCPALLAALRAGGDRFLEHALIYALIRINDRASTLAALDDPDPRVRRAGLIALDQMKDGGLTEAQVAPLLASSDPDLQRAALEVVSRRPAWSSLVRDLLTSWLSSPALSPAQERLLADALPAIGGEPGVSEVVAEALAAPGLPSRPGCS